MPCLRLRHVGLFSLTLALAAAATPGCVADLGEDVASTESALDAAESYRVFVSLEPGFAERAGIRAAIARGDLPGAARLLRDHFKRRAKPVYFTSYEADRPPPNPNYNRRPADEIIAHRIPVRLFQAGVQFPTPIDFRAPPLDDEEKAVLQRHEWVKTLADAYWFTSDTKYLTKCLELMRAWREQFPPSVGENDRAYTGLETGARVPRWIEAIYRFVRSPSLSDSDFVFILSSLIEQGMVLAEYRGRGNHATTAWSGLAQLGFVLPELKRGDGWRDLGVALLEEQSRTENLPDGNQFELSAGYHTNNLAAYSIIQRLASLNDYAGGAGFAAQLLKMHEATLAIMRPDKTVPLINDSGAGRYPLAWMGYGALTYDRPDMKFAAALDLRLAGDTLGGLSDAEHARYDAITPAPPAFTSIALPYSGFYVQRSGWSPLDKYLLLDVGKEGGPHTHNAHLAIELYAGGRSLLVDPGIGHYTDRVGHDFFKSPQGHNVVLLDGQGAAREAMPENVSFMTSKGMDVVEGDVALRDGRWRRSAVFVRSEYWLVMDRVTAPDLAGRQLDQLWHYVPGELAEGPTPSSRRLLNKPGFVPAPNLLMQWPESRNVRFESRPGFLAKDIAGGLGADADGKAAVPYLAVTQTSPSNVAWFPTLLAPYPGDATPASQIVMADLGTSNAVLVGQGNHQDLFFFGAFDAYGYRFDGSVAFYRKTNNKAAVIGLHGGTTFETPGSIVRCPSGCADVVLYFVNGALAAREPAGANVTFALK